MTKFLSYRPKWNFFFTIHSINSTSKKNENLLEKQCLKPHFDHFLKSGLLGKKKLVFQVYNICEMLMPVSYQLLNQI